MFGKFTSAIKKAIPEPDEEELARDIEESGWCTREHGGKANVGGLIEADMRFKQVPAC
jgi:hypothetical protein